MRARPFFKDIKRSLTINPFIFIGVGPGIFMQLSALYLMPGWFNAVPLSIEQWIYVAYISLFAFGIVEVRKWMEFLLDRHRIIQNET